MNCHALLVCNRLSGPCEPSAHSGLSNAGKVASEEVENLSSWDQLMREPIYMPKFGMTMTEGLIATWHKQEGDIVKEGDILFTVQTEKVDTDVEAPASGTLVSVQYAEGDEAAVGEIIAYIERT
jgi:biotin carboxyl carrier protein